MHNATHLLAWLRESERMASVGSSALLLCAYLSFMLKDAAAWPSSATLARVTGLTEQQVRVHKRRLIDLGIIKPAGMKEGIPGREVCIVKLRNVPQHRKRKPTPTPQFFTPSGGKKTFPHPEGKPSLTGKGNLPQNVNQFESLTIRTAAEPLNAAAADALISFGVEEKKACQFIRQNGHITQHVIQKGIVSIGKRKNVANPPMYLLAWLQSDSGKSEASKIEKQKNAQQRAAGDEQRAAEDKRRAADELKARREKIIARINAMSDVEYRAWVESYTASMPEFMRGRAASMKRHDALKSNYFIDHIFTKGTP